MLPRLAPARLPMVTPARLYQPMPPAMDTDWFRGEVQQHAADNASRQGAQDDANRNDQGLQTDFSGAGTAAPGAALR